MTKRAADQMQDAVIIPSRRPAVEWVLRADGGWDVVDAAEQLTEMIDVARGRITANRMLIRQTRELISAVRERVRLRQQWRAMSSSSPLH